MIKIELDPNDKGCFYLRVPFEDYESRAKIKKLGGLWSLEKKCWKFAFDLRICNLLKRDLGDKIENSPVFTFLLKQKEKEEKVFLSYKEIAEKDEPIDFAVDGVELNGKNPFFNYQKHGVKCCLSAGNGFLIGDVPGLGKCLKNNNLCQFESGIKRISSIIEKIDEKMWYLSEDGVGEWIDYKGNDKLLGNNSGVKEFFPIKRIYREKVRKTGLLITQSGVRNEFGLNHKFYTNHGWKKLSELSNSDWILCEDKIDTSVKIHYDNEDVFWLAWQIGEGSDASLDHQHSITNSDLSVLERIKNHLDSFNMIREDGEKYVISILKDRGRTVYRLNFNRIFTKYLNKTFGYKLCTKSGTKEIPMSILNASDENVRIFVSSLWEADGCCNKDNIEFTSKSYDVCEKLWYLMKRFGVFGIIRSRTAKVKNGIETYWRINVGGIFVRRFKEEFGFLSERKQKALEILCQKDCNTNVGYSSPCKHHLINLVENILETSYRLVNLNVEKVKRKNQYGIDFIKNFCANLKDIVVRGVYKKKSKWTYLEDSFNENRIARKLEVDSIISDMEKYYIGNDFQWLKVEDVIEKEEESYVYDFEIDNENHNYFVGGLLTHNTIQAIGVAKERFNRGEIKNCLIICPASLKYNWLNEINKFTKDQAIVIDGTKEERQSKWFAKGYLFKITNFETVVNDLYFDKRAKAADRRIEGASAIINGFFDQIVIDEIHYIKSGTAIRSKAVKMFKCKYKLGLTGTPIDGKLEELQSIFEFIKPGLFPSRSKFLERYADLDFYGAVLRYKNVKEVKEKISPYYLRRLKQTVFKDLPPKIFKDVYVEMGTKEMKVYKDLIKKKNEITKEEDAAVVVVRARQFCDFPELLDMRNPSAKFAALDNLLEELIVENKEKVIIFTQYKKALDLIYLNLKDKYNIVQIHGEIGPQERVEVCGKFNNDPNVNIILMTDAGSVGLNLQEAHDVIHFDDNYSPAVMQQRNDRAHSGTTKHVVTIYRFICKDTIEEKVREQLEAKMEFNNIILDEDCDEFRSSGKISNLELINYL